VNIGVTKCDEDEFERLCVVQPSVPMRSFGRQADWHLGGKRTAHTVQTQCSQIKFAVLAVNLFSLCAL